MEFNITVDEETYAAIQALRANVIEGTADPLNDALAIYLGVRLALLISIHPQEKWHHCLGLAVKETYAKKHNGI